MIFNMTSNSGNGGWSYVNLNFSIIRYGLNDTLPDTAEENTIAVFTDAEISSYIFDVNAPENPEDGMVWFETNNTTSSAPFNVLKENNIQIYPIRARQYISGAWVSVEAKTYQNEWKRWWYGNLFYHGDKYEDITGGWYSWSSGWSGVEFTNIMYSPWYKLSASYGAAAITNDKIDLTNFNTLKVHYVSADGNQTVAVGETTSLNTSDFAAVAYGSLKSAGMISCNISSLKGKYHVLLINGAGEGEFKIDEVWLE